MCSSVLESLLGCRIIHELIKLRRIDVRGTLKYLREDLAELVNDFSSRVSARGQLVVFRWTWTVSNCEGYHVLSQMAAKLANVSQHSFELTIQRRDMASHAEMMPLFPVLGSLNLQGYIPCSEPIVHDDTIFPRLTHLRIKNDDIGRRHSDNLTKFVPSHFPALQYLRMSYPHGCSSIVEPMFDHTWSTVTKFDLGFCDSAAFFDRIVWQLPNVTELEISRSYFPVDIHAIATHMPRLQTLQVVISERALTPRLADGAVFANLTKFGLKYSLFGKDVIRPEWLSLMLDCAPNLREVQIKGYSLAKAVLRKFAGRTNPSVRSLEVMPWYGSKKKVDALADIDTWMAFFPSTKMIEVPCDGIVDLSAVKQRYPNTIIIIKRI
ncbi:hypothetical protein GQ42DRAFT_162903 [Ramicandelaber brevisporus]|nr:hypothetical protein GQ42DRAFT_162903 [Ramicandelaber brevisporus]